MAPRDQTSPPDSSPDRTPRGRGSRTGLRGGAKTKRAIYLLPNVRLDWVEWGCRRVADNTFADPVVLQAVARRLLRGGRSVIGRGTS
jgi:hypothetical protein